MALTIGQTIEEIRTTLRDYIEAAYHISHPRILRQRREILDTPGVIHQLPFLESTPRYKPGPSFSDLGLPKSVLEIYGAVEGSAVGIYDPPL